MHKSKPETVMEVSGFLDLMGLESNIFTSRPISLYSLLE